MPSPSPNADVYRRLLDRSPAGLLVTTLDGEILQANRAAADVLGFDSPQELQQTNVRDHYVDPDQRKGMIQEIAETGRVENIELLMETQEGEQKWLLTTINAEQDEDLGTTVLLGTWVDVTRQRRLREKLEHLAQHDDLTGLLNRRALFERSEQVLAMCERENRMAVVVYLDVAGFKQVNDQIGHRGGDRVLAAVGQRLRETMRESDLVARIGGDEFVILATLVQRDPDVEQVGRRVMYAFQEPFEAAGTMLRLEPAAGLSVYPDDGGDIDSLLHRADQALWGPERKKLTGFRRYQAMAESEATVPWDVPGELTRALQVGDELFLVFQPIVAARGGEVVGLEALVRWQHPEHGLIGPGAFIPEAEASGVIRQLDRRVFRLAIEQAATWLSGGREFGWLSVNLSAQSLSDPGCVGWMTEALDDQPEIAPKQVVLEITEHAAMQQASRDDVLRELNDQVGVSISIDDFGIGYSSLLYLREFPADYLKIDMQFVQNVVDSEPDQKVIEGIIGLGRGFDLKLIAEGVETEEQAAWLREAGCDLLQGYRFGRPGRAGEVEEFLLT